MSKTIRPITFTINVSGGTGTINTGTVATIKASSGLRAINNAGGYLEQILVKAPSVPWTFDFAITDADGFVVFDKIGARGRINDVPHIPMPSGAYDMTITNAVKSTGGDADGAYKCKLHLKEEW